MADSDDSCGSDNEKRREECERKARRGEMDPRLEFTFQLLTDHTDLTRSEVMDQVFEGNMLDEINQLFLPNMRSKIMWFYQEVDDLDVAAAAAAAVPSPKDPGKIPGNRNSLSKVMTTLPAKAEIPKKLSLFITDGTSVPLTGICIYVLRLNNTKPLPEEGFHKDLLCGIINAADIGLVTCIERVMENVFMQALSYTFGDDEDVTTPMVKHQLLPSLTSFCSALKVCEQVCGRGDIFEDNLFLENRITNPAEMKNFLSDATRIEALESKVKVWMKKLQGAINECEQLRTESDTSKPQDELEYWKKRCAQFSQIMSGLRSREVQLSIRCLTQSRSKLMKLWKELEDKATIYFNEARDNAKYVQVMEKSCQSLYLNDPVKMKDSLANLLQTVKMIHGISQFYNTPERISSLMIKITNQMIETCKLYVTPPNEESLWRQDGGKVCRKLEDCVRLNESYKKAYDLACRQRVPSTRPDSSPFQFSQNYVFGKFDAFCERLKKILKLFDLMDDYKMLFEKRVEGLLLGDALDDVVKAFNEAKSEITNKNYDYLNHKNENFDEDFNIFVGRMGALKKHMAAVIEENFRDVWETPQGFKFLTKFENISEKIPLTDLDKKYARVVKYCELEMERILKMFRKKKHDPPVAPNFPPIAGRIKWSRCLKIHLDELLADVLRHPVLKSVPTTLELGKKYEAASLALAAYEEELVKTWLHHNVWIVEDCLKQPLLKMDDSSCKLIVNLNRRVEVIMREAECMKKMKLPCPNVTLAILSKRDFFLRVKDSMQFLLRFFTTTAASVKEEIRPLLSLHLAGVVAAFSPGTRDITWTDSKWQSFAEEVGGKIEDFQVLIKRIHDIFENRVVRVLGNMENVTAHSLPGDESWSIETFLERNEKSSVVAAEELHKKSALVEEAVEEMIKLGEGCGNFPLIEGQGQGETRQPDWNTVTACFDKPFSLLYATGCVSRAATDVVPQAAAEMRRLYSRKVARVLTVVVKVSMEAVCDTLLTNSGIPVFYLEAALNVPTVSVKPNLDEIQETVEQVGKIFQNVAKGVGQWSTDPKRQKNDDFPSLESGKESTDDCRIRRRKLYKLPSETKIAFPFKPRNFYQIVADDKGVEKMAEALAACTKSVKIDLDIFMSRWSKYDVLWTEKTNSSELADCEAALRLHSSMEIDLKSEPDRLTYGAVVVNIERLKATLLSEIRGCDDKIARSMKKRYHREMDYIYAVISDMERKLQRPIRDLDDVRFIMDILRKIREQEIDMELKIEPIEEAYNLIVRSHLSVDKEQMERVDNLRYTWQRLLARALDVNVLLSTMQPHFEEELRGNLDKFKNDSQEYCKQYQTSGPMMAGLTPREASDRLILFQNRFDGMWRKLQAYQSGEELFGLPTTEYPELSQIRKELNLLQKLYKLYNDVIDRVASYYDIPWSDVNIEEINNELMEFQNRCRKLPKGLKEWPAFHALKRSIDDFNDMCPLLELMANKAMKPRHWNRIMEVTNYNFDLESEGFCLKNILEAPLLKFKEDIEDICISAMKEKDIEAKLRQVTNEWSAHELTFMMFNNRGELLLRGDTTAETIGHLEDSLMVLGSLLSNRYNAPFRKQIQQWVYDLSNTNEILERWLLVQNMWVYLEAVFVGGDIAKQLPKEAKRFSKIDKSWQKIMQRAHETPGVVACCVGDDVLKQLLPHLQEQLELCQKSLSGYLEKKRMMFPRFFFVSDPTLLEILGQASDSHTIQNHLMSIFDNTRAVKFHDIDYNKITGIISSEGEMIQLEKAVRAEGSVETWLAALLSMSQKSVHSIIRTAHYQINDPQFSLLPFLEKMPAQVGILGIQMLWTRDSESALSQARTDKKIMAQTNNRFLDILNTLIDQTTRNLTKLERIKFETLITIHVHQRDIFDALCRLNVRSSNDFEWLKQSRFYFKEDLDKTWISITDVCFAYQNEYLGCTERLVITPLTDRCYITLAQALAMSMGGSPCGPAGTGKTETVKDMGKTLGKYVVVFNCSDQMDYRGLGRIYKGLAQSGAWGCFDEFNRIELPVLSVAAQQISTVLLAKKEKKKQFVFTDGDLIDMFPEFGIFITMNPSYAGRKQLPENLKIQFRTVAMMVPDRQIIIRVKLASCGFLENITLARKFYTLYKLCEEQLTKQVHYDFGLRNILSVLRTLGTAKRVNSKDSESTIVMRVLRDMNLSKLIDEDEPLFMSLVSDLFPNQTLDKTSYPELEEAIIAEVDRCGLVYHPPWVLKIIQLYETQRVRHGIMILGPAGAGKTTCIQTLMKAMSTTEEHYRELRMNPKAITTAQMFGKLDVATNDWTDGIFSALWRKTLKLKKGENVWLVLDGPVDSIWIENLNSVLDDNRTLTLANGDRLPMSACCKVIFEPHNIDNASPATVSRNGMVYMSSSGLDWKPILSAWLKKRRPWEGSALQHLFEQSFAAIYAWTSQNLTFVMKVLQCNLVQQMLTLLEGLLGPIDTQTPAEDGEEEEHTQRFSRDQLQKIYLFALTWSVGAFLENEDRGRFDSFVRKHFPDFHFPEKCGRDGDTLFDFFIDNDGFWQPWSSMITNFAFSDAIVPDYSNVTIPIVENIRIDYLIDCVAKQEKAVLLVGEQGVGKTCMIKNYMKKSNPDVRLGRSFNFSSATTPYQFQKTIESYVEKRMGSTFGPPGGRKMTVFIDDVNLPHINEWGDQVTNEIVRQTMDMKGFYSLEKPGEFNSLADVQFVAAMSHPGGGRNDIPSRLKRQFSIFNCTLPSDESIDKIFGVISEGHYNAKRGFALEVRNLVKKLVPLTRKLWKMVRANLLPTPAKFHYIFSLRELSRIWQGIVGTLSTVIESEDILMHLWKHECTRVFSDRFTFLEDKVWFDEALLNVVGQHLEPKYQQMALSSPVFVDFMRDAPEPTGEEGEEADMELPKVYEPVYDMSELKDRLDMFLSQFNEMVRGAGMDLVFFPDAVMHLVKISRVIRHPKGNVMLIGVGGSGKQSLVKLASFIAGYKTFQISLTRSYNISNFLEDLKLLYRTCGVQGKGTTFIFTDQDIKEEGFLEYLNNILSSGVISNLFTRDEQAEIVSELTPVMRRENPKRTLTSESVLEYFLQRVCQNLHVVFCFSPVGEKFRNRVMQFPALVSGCTVDWFQPWPRDALVQVAQHFLTDFEIECTPEVKEELVGALGTIQDVVSATSTEYFQRYRRATHVTPKSYLNFIGGYKTIYTRKREELADGARRMDVGLAKLEEASISVEALKNDLSKMERELAEASQKAENVLNEVTERARQAEGVKDHVMRVKEKAEVLVTNIAKEKKVAEEKLDAAKPALLEAEAALNTIKPAHIATIRKLGRPPHLIMRIMDCVLILFQRKLHPVIGDTSCPCPKPSWAESLKMMASTTFLLQLQNYPKDVINDEMVELLQPYFQMDDYNMDTAKRVCGDVAGLLSWTKAMAFFHSVNKEVLPLKANLAMQEARLKVAMDDLANTERELEDKEAALDRVKAQYDAAVNEKQRLTDALHVCLRKMTAATALINGLGGEKIRWSVQSKEFKEQNGRLVGDVLLATGFLSYCGPYNQAFRSKLVNAWMDILKSRLIPFTEYLNITTMLIDSSQVSDWTLQGLPNDELSVQNALIVSKSSSYPLLIDPQNQAKIWIKNKEANNELQITSLNHKYFRNHLEDSLSLGRPLLIEDVGEELDPVIDNVLEKNFIKSGSIEKVVVGDKENDVMPGFNLYITTKLPNPAYSPEISAKISVIDFTVTMQGLEDQLLGRVISTEKSDLESERVALFESVLRNQKTMKELESNLLHRLTSSRGSLVDDEALIRVLQETKATAEEVNAKLRVSEQTEKKITAAREEYRAVASRGSILYFLIVEMSNVNVMYQNSLKQFLTIFDDSITKSVKSAVTEERIENILKYLTYEIWKFTQRSLYERHKLLFTLMFAMKIDCHKGNITHEKFTTFVKGGASLDLNAVTPKPFRWILDITWLNLVELSKLATFANILTKIKQNEKEWRTWYEKEFPEEEEVPCGYGKILDIFEKLLLIRCWSPDRTLSQAKKYIEESLGCEYGESCILNLENTLEESDARTPLICLLSIGSDPSSQIASLAKSKSISLRSISMGQGQEVLATDAISEAMTRGDWILLQNAHLSLPFCNEMADSLSDAEPIHEHFRLWMTTDVHPQFPIGLLQIAIKFTNEPPQGIRASLKRTYQNITQDTLDYSVQGQWPPLLYALAFLHTVLQERRKFGPLGWNVPYEFNQADFLASVQFVQNHLDDMDPKKGISWATICYMLGEVQYGGRVTDDFDKRLLTTFTQVWFNDVLLKPGFEFFKNYKVPNSRNIQSYVDYINTLPLVDSPEVFGLHPNADITYQINTAKGILDAILNVQPKEGGSQGGETRESVVYKLAEDMLRKFPKPYNDFEVKEALQRMGPLLPMNIFLRQEIDRMQHVISQVSGTLNDLKLAIDGTIVMSAGLREALDAMYDARVPQNWKKVSWESSTLGFWFTELLERDAQFRKWCNVGRPNVFWMTGFFNPQGFLTAMRQEVTRAHKGWALDSVVLQNEITRYNKEEIQVAPPEGVYVYGLFLEGASWDRRSGKLTESKPKVLYEQMPVVHIKAVNTTAGKDARTYECPIYRKTHRSDSNYVGSIDFETDVNPRHWTLRGVALLCDIK